MMTAGKFVYDYDLQANDIVLNRPKLRLFDRDLSGSLFVTLNPHRAPWETEGLAVPRNTRCEIEVSAVGTDLGGASETAG